MSSEEIRQKFLKFFEERGHKVVPSSSLIPDDPSVLLTTAGMQQFKPYFVGKADPLKDFGAPRTASIQKCFRTSDIDEVGDTTHLTFFEMLGHFSFGDYFKKETIAWTYELLTKEFRVAPERIAAGVFKGDETVPFDQESFDAWAELLPPEKIKKGPRSDNFWGPAGTEGPCGAANEVYVDGIEVATLVFMEYYAAPNGSLTPLPKKGVDVGWGFERLTQILQTKKNVFEIDLLSPLFVKVSEYVPAVEERVRRILADHLRGAVFLAADGLRPSNKEAGYILRRLLRRIMAYQVRCDIHPDLFPEAVRILREKFGGYYPELENEKTIVETLELERGKFERLVASGMKELARFPHLTGKDAFYLYESFGLPYELIREFASAGATRDLRREEFEKELEKHKKISRAGAEKKFGGHGLLLDTGELRAGNEEEIKKVTRLHTVTHLMNQALHDILGDEVDQRGSDITPERTRFDFMFPRKLTSEEIKNVEEAVNEKIKEDLSVRMKEMPVEEALKLGVRKFYKAKYPPIARVYYIGESEEIGKAYSREFCGGPHVAHTGEIGKFKITKEEASSSGVRRIRAIVA